jgi:hypothetical protein
LDFRHENKLAKVLQLLMFRLAAKPLSEVDPVTPGSQALGTITLIALSTSGSMEADIVPTL